MRDAQLCIAGASSPSAAPAGAPSPLGVGRFSFPVLARDHLPPRPHKRSVAGLSPRERLALHCLATIGSATASPGGRGFRIGGAGHVFRTIIYDRLIASGYARTGRLRGGEATVQITPAGRDIAALNSDRYEIAGARR